MLKWIKVGVLVGIRTSYSNDVRYWMEVSITNDMSYWMGVSSIEVNSATSLPSLALLCLFVLPSS